MKYLENISKGNSFLLLKLKCYITLAGILHQDMTYEEFPSPFSISLMLILCSYGT